MFITRSARTCWKEKASRAGGLGGWGLRCFDGVTCGPIFFGGFGEGQVGAGCSGVETIFGS